MINIAPELRTGHEKLGDFAATIVEDQRIPVRMKAQSRIRVLVQARSVEHRQTMHVRREMARDPVDQNADPALMHMINEVLEIVRRSKPRCGCEVACRLIAPRPVKRMLGNGHQLNVSVAHLSDVVGQRMSQLTVVKKRATVLWSFP